MKRLGLAVNAVGLLISAVGTLVLYAHVTNRYHSQIADIGSVAVGYLGVILFGVSVSLSRIALLLWETRA
ncbi:hypothetical protein EXE43_05275 [Halorubrum sp. SS5]|nr:hypothetical protein EXE43_05275 [Halorubrum sp. SS5]